MTNLSDFIEKQNIERIDVLKIDTEGAELKILNGIKDDHWEKIKQLIIEIHHDDYVEPIMEILDRNGFTNIAVKRDDYLKTEIGNYQLLFATKAKEPIESSAYIQPEYAGVGKETVYVFQ